MSRFASAVWFTAVLGLVAGAAAGQPAGTVTLDFEGLAVGEIVTAVPHPGSDRMIRIRGFNPEFPRNAAVIFDSSNPGSEDPDLGSPHHDFEVPGEGGEPMPGPGLGRGGVKGAPCQNARPLGKILIVEDDFLPMTEDGRVEEPDDEGRSGTRLEIDFSELGKVTIHGMAVIDIEEPDAVVWFYNVPLDVRRARPRHHQVLGQYSVHTEDNGVARLFDPEIRNVPEEGCHVTLERRKHGQVLDPISGVRSLEVDFSGSGAIARIIYSVPQG